MDPKAPRLIGPATMRKVVAASVLMAAFGVVLYARSPGVGSYQASGLLVLPLLIVVLVWVHKHLPKWLQWGAALVLAVAGPAGYLIFGGDQWWNWGQFMPVPLVALIASRPARFERREGDSAWYGGPTDGPWGPP